MKDTIIMKSLVKVDKTYQDQYKALWLWCKDNGYEIKSTSDCFYASYRFIEGSKEEKDFLRAKRKPLLRAFTNWATNVSIGIESLDNSILAWRLKLLDLDKSAFSEVPAKIQYYVEK